MILKRSINLVRKSYSNISSEDLMKITGIKNIDDLNNFALTCNWQIDENFGYIIDNATNIDNDLSSANQEQLEKLTEYVAFLENY